VDPEGLVGRGVGHGEGYPSPLGNGSEVGSKPAHIAQWSKHLGAMCSRA